MKKIFATIALALFLSLPLISLSDPPPPPGQTGGGQGGGQVPVGAPIGDGVGILLVLGAAYGGWKFYNYRKNKVVGVEE